MIKNYFEAEIERIEKEGYLDTNEDIVYAVAFNILCAMRNRMNPDKYNKNQDQNQDDLNNKLVPQVMKALFEAIEED